MPEVIVKKIDPKVTDDDFEAFLVLNGFNIRKHGTNTASKGRLNVSWIFGYSIMGNHYEYGTMKQIAKRFARYEPTWDWKYITLFKKPYKMNLP